MFDCPVDIVSDVVHLTFFYFVFCNTNLISEAREKCFLQKVVNVHHQTLCPLIIFDFVLNCFYSGACVIIGSEYIVFSLSWQTYCETCFSRTGYRELKFLTTKTKQHRSHAAYRSFFEAGCGVEFFSFASTVYIHPIRFLSKLA